MVYLHPSVTIREIQSEASIIHDLSWAARCYPNGPSQSTNVRLRSVPPLAIPTQWGVLPGEKLALPMTHNRPSRFEQASLDGPDTWPALLAKLVATRGDHPAIVTARETISYRELEMRTSQMVRAMIAAGAGKGTRIGLLAPDGVFWLTVFLAGLRIGSLTTLISTLATPRELAHILRHSDVQFLLSARRFLRHDYAEMLEEAFPALANANPGMLGIAEAPYLRRIWLIDAADVPWAGSIDNLLSLGQQQVAASSSLLREMEKEVSPADRALVVYTSGSTAQPKAVVHDQWTLARHPPQLARFFAMKSEDRMMCLLPLFWLAGLSTAMQVICVGATLVYPEAPDIDSAIEAISNLSVTRVNAWGGKRPQLIANAKQRGLDLSHIPDLVGFRDREGNVLPNKISMYGMTESFSAHSAEPLDERVPECKATSYGRSMHDYERRVVDEKSGAELPAGAIGELQIRGPALMTGLYKKRRNEIFTSDGFYPTKDLASIDEDGWLYPAGRTDDMIKSKAANVSRLEVEEALNALPQVLQSIVVGLPHPDSGQIVVAAVVPAENTLADEHSLQDLLRTSISSFKIPRRIIFIKEEEIPRTATGKIKLFEAKRLIAERIEYNAG